jgi:hypothetical protein
MSGVDKVFSLKTIFTLVSGRLFEPASLDTNIINTDRVRQRAELGVLVQHILKRNNPISDLDLDGLAVTARDHILNSHKGLATVQRTPADFFPYADGLPNAVAVHLQSKWLARMETLFGSSVPIRSMDQPAPIVASSIGSAPQP